MISKEHNLTENDSKHYFYLYTLFPQFYVRLYNNPYNFHIAGL